MLDASSSAMTSPTLQTVKPTVVEPTATDAPSRTPPHKGHVQAWMPVTIASPQTADAILELPIGGPTPAE